MATKSADYWIERAGKRLIKSELTGKAAIVRTLSLYDQSQKNLERELQAVYNSYSKEGILDVSQLKKAIGPDGAKEFMGLVDEKAKKLGINPKRVYDERYLSRITRLEAIQEQIRLEVMSIAPREESISSQAYRKIIQDSYSGAQSDLELVGINPSFSTLNNRVADAILRSKWMGDNYSNRVWGNTEKLAARLPSIMGGALSIGQSYAKTAMQLRQRFDVARFEAVRLVRTETNYYHNQAELQSYIDDGIEEYTLDVTLDGRTSKVCLAVDEDHVYKVTEVIVGVNYPPLHPQCRTVPRAVLKTDLPKPRTNKERVQRFVEADTDELQSRWKKAMQKQMDPNKAVHDYNAEMNILTQNLQNKVINQQKFNDQLDDLMLRIPEDYPLKGGLEKIAKLNGWVEDDFTKNQAKLNKTMAEIGLNDSGVLFDREQSNFINRNNIKFQNVRSGTDDLNGAYNQENNTVSFDTANLKAVANELGDKNYINEVVQHELGHAIDRFGRNNQSYSNSNKFSRIIKDNPVEPYSISKYRFIQGMSDDTMRASFNKMTPEVYASMAQGGQKFTIQDTNIGVPEAMFNYHTQPDEIFAQGYTLFKNKPEWMQANAPKTFDYFSEFFNTKQ